MTNTKTRKPIDLDAWGALTPEQAVRQPRLNPPPGDPIPEVAYEDRTVRQLIYTFTKVNPAWAATVHSRMEPSRLAARLGLVAVLHGYDLDHVPGLREAHRLEEALERIAVALLDDALNLAEAEAR
ncbi:hypothetical protein [Microbacterium istanbulense]|uniref:Uncharacterized protein n=1 Tax=Microbacterium istanbulense TaxID=3122049 RepID=A0ABU8LLJ0_9MICO